LTQQGAGIALCANGDLTLARIVINNLLDNAASHAPAGSEIRIDRQINGDRIELKISNPAHDLPADLDRLFEPLFRRDGSRQESESHLGIGMTLSLDAALAMGGSLHVRQPEADRIEFIFTLPHAAD
jgi:signal transduction histidine kinase